MVRHDRQSKALTYHVDLPGGQARLRDLIIYVSARCADSVRFGMIKLNKIIWRADFTAFADRGVPVTGRYYQRLRLGPAPVEMPPVLREMQQDQLIEISVTDFGVAPDGSPIREYRPVALVKPSLRWFSDDDIKYVDASISHYWAMTGMETSDESHGVPWKSRENSDPMPYEAAHLLSDELPPDVALRLEKLAREQGWQSE